MDSKVLMESILLIDTINKYLQSTETGEKFYYEENFIKYKLTLIKYIELYFNTTLNNPNKLLGFFDKINTTIKDALTSYGLYFKNYEFEDLLNLAEKYMSKYNYENSEEIDILYDNAKNSHNMDDKLYSIYKLLKYLNYFDERTINNKDIKIKKISKKKQEKNDE